ncbi:MAG: hypothetical protein K9I29_05275 [Bacteroidales bacterium]|nr:hypothetical protein [Bacteroidales bacterium]
MISSRIRNKYVKKILVLTFILIAISVNAYSQINPNALGVRVFKGEFYGVELSYQGRNSSSERLLIDLGYEDNDYFTRYYTIVTPNSGWKKLYKGLNLYGGIALGLGYLTTTGSFHQSLFQSFSFNFGWQWGLEYNFNRHEIPILVSFDIRPLIDFCLNDYYESVFTFNAAFSIRYVF